MYDTATTVVEVQMWLFVESDKKENVVYVVLKTGSYKVEVFDRQQNRYVQSISGLGMHVDVKDPQDKTLLSRVRHIHVNFSSFFV